MNELTATERRKLKARAHALKPVVMIGNDGLTPAILAETDRALNAHELIKIRARTDDRARREEWSANISRHCGATLIQHLGKILLLHRPKPETQSPTNHSRESDVKPTTRGARVSQQNELQRRSLTSRTSNPSGSEPAGRAEVFERRGKGNFSGPQRTRARTPMGVTRSARRGSRTA